MDSEYKNLRQSAINGVTMTTSTGDDSIAAVKKIWSYWNDKDVAKDSVMSAALKRNMIWQYYAIANSNAMDGLNTTSRLKRVNTWYDNVLLATSIVSGVLTAAAVVMYMLSRRKFAVTRTRETHIAQNVQNTQNAQKGN